MIRAPKQRLNHLPVRLRRRILRDRRIRQRKHLLWEMLVQWYMWIQRRKCWHRRGFPPDERVLRGAADGADAAEVVVSMQFLEERVWEE